ncbi:MAG: LapA family protein [Bacillota bacterium]
MGSLLLILALAFSLLIAVVAIANNQTVSVSYLFGRAEVSLIILILGSAISGALAMGAFSLFRGIRTALRFREGRRRQDELLLKIEQFELEKATIEARLARLAAMDQPATEAVAPSEENLAGRDT